MLVFALRPPGQADPTIDVLMQPVVSFEEVYGARLEKDIAGVRVPVASIPHLIALKTGTGRLKDESDIVALRALEAERGRKDQP